MEQTVHFILKGVLDRSLAETVLDEIGERPYIHYRADGSGLFSIDFYAACMLKDRVLKLGGQFAILDLSDECRIALQYCGWPVHDGVALVASENPTTENSNLEVSGGEPEAPCPGCGKGLKIDGVGLYSCPVCGTHFHADNRGRTTPYESMHLSQ